MKKVARQTGRVRRHACMRPAERRARSQCPEPESLRQTRDHSPVDMVTRVRHNKQIEERSRP